MQYKTEVLYTYGWDDTCWTEESTNGTTYPLRFQTIDSAQMELDVFFAHVKDAMAAGNMDIEENPNHYRIVAVK